MGRKFGFSWSWRRATGVSSLKNKISRKTGIPLSRSGRQRKVGRALGCCFMMVSGVGLAVGMIVVRTVFY